MRSFRAILTIAGLLLFIQTLAILWLGTSPRGSFASNLAQLGLGILVIVASLLVARRSGTLGRHVWRLTALAYSVWCIAQALATYGDALPSEVRDWVVNLLFSFWFVPIGMALFLDPDSEPAEFDCLVAFDCLQAILFWVAAYVCFFLIPSHLSAVSGFSPTALVLYFAYYGLLVLGFFLRVLLSAPGVARTLFRRIGILLLLSALLDAFYFYGPGKNMPAGSWFDLLWSLMLVIPLLTATTWGDAERRGEATPAVAIGVRGRILTQLFSLLYPLLILVMSVKIAEHRLLLATTVILISFICFSIRAMLIQHRLLHTQEALRHEATHDGLTGIWNRITILDILRRELLRAEREGSSVGIIMADVDHFKLVNDNLGHASGDMVLRTAASEIAAALRPYDSVGRYGGEEFLVVAPACNAAQTWELAERVRDHIENRAIVAKGKPVHITLSMGIAAGSYALVTESLLHAADTALYDAKSKGRNRVEPQSESEPTQSWAKQLGPQSN
ncbi:MAG TPA: GGDEF domain-containing protein [Terriglobales bacterium]|nr:GGDEF domain-containing protein [Terriglobales bacterium]